MVRNLGFFISREIQSGTASVSRNNSQKREIHWFLIDMVGASTRVGRLSLFITSSPSMVLPDPGGAITCRCLLYKWSSSSWSTLSWYFRQGYLNLVWSGNSFKVWCVFSGLLIGWQYIKNKNPFCYCKRDGKFYKRVVICLSALRVFLFLSDAVFPLGHLIFPDVFYGYA